MLLSSSPASVPAANLILAPDSKRVDAPVAAMSPSLAPSSSSTSSTPSSPPPPLVVGSRSRHGRRRAAAATPDRALFQAMADEAADDLLQFELFEPFRTLATAILDALRSHFLSSPPTSLDPFRLFRISDVALLSSLSADQRTHRAAAAVRQLGWPPALIIVEFALQPIGGRFFNSEHPPRALVAPPHAVLSDSSPPAFRPHHPHPGPAIPSPWPSPHSGDPIRLLRKESRLPNAVWVMSKCNTGCAFV